MSLQTTSFCLAGPGYAAKYIQRPFGREVFFEPISKEQKVSSVELSKCFNLVGLRPYTASEWETADALVRIAAVLDGDAVMSLNISLDFSGEYDPRRSWSSVWTLIKNLSFRPLEDGSLITVDEQIAHSLACEAWDQRGRRSPTSDSPPQAPRG